MAFHGNQNRNRSFGGNMGGANRMANLNMSPWDTQNNRGNYSGNNANMHQSGGGGGGGSGGPGMNAQALSLANNLLNNLFRHQIPPSLLDLPRGRGGMGAGNRNQRGGPMMNRGGGGNRVNNNRRIQGGFPNRGTSGLKSNQKQQGAGGIRKQSAFDRGAKKLLAKNAINKKKDFAHGDQKPESNKESPYAGVSNDMFYCHLCKKHMWDATSFENHIKGRTHIMMREGIEESYRLKANMIRQEAKIAEQLKSIELDRLKRMGKSKQHQLEYCTMCDLNFHGHISGHRKTEGHLQLKKFLHPKCVECFKEFATRTDYDTHLLSAEHLMKAAEKNTKVGERKQNTLTIQTEEEELKDVRIPQRRRKVATDLKKEEGDEEENTIIDSGEQKDDEANGAKEGEEDLNETQEGETEVEKEDAIAPVDPEDVIVDYVEGNEIPMEVENQLPKYNWTRPVGAALITKIDCYECALCAKFMDNEETVQVHARTMTHHRNFLRFINDKSSDAKIAQKRAYAAIEENERKKKLCCSEENAADNKNGQALEANGEDKEQQDAVEDKNDNKGELYDPAEVTGEDEDVKMTEIGKEENANNTETTKVDNEKQEECAIEKEEKKEEEKAKETSVKVEINSTTMNNHNNMMPTQNQQPTATANRGGARGGAKGNQRGRGRGRYSRY